jgi:hypothetical protein
MISSDIVFRGTCRPPDDWSARGSRPITKEEAGSLWLWAWPELLGWPATITWLFSPVVGNKSWPGDVWGVDDRGELLIVETKLWMVGTKQDPFRDFVENGALAVRPDSPCIQAEALRCRWWKDLQAERQFIKEHRRDLQVGTQLRGRYQGVVPYSSHRSQVWRWRGLYLTHVAPTLNGRRYAARVRRNLLSRRRNENPPPHFIGLFTMHESGTPALSRAGFRNYTTLCARVGRDRVHMVSVEARPVRRWFVEIVSRRVPALSAY